MAGVGELSSWATCVGSDEQLEKSASNAMAGNQKELLNYSAFHWYMPC